MSLFINITKLVYFLTRGNPDPPVIEFNPLFDKNYLHICDMSENLSD